MSVACRVAEVEELKSLPLAVCWKMMAASQSWEGRGLYWGSVGGASPGCERRRHLMRRTFSDWGSVERCHGRLC